MTSEATKTAALLCSFCGKTAQEVRKLIAGPNAHICDECVVLCVEVIAETSKPDRDKHFESPNAILEAISRTVIGQEDAKRALAISVFIHHHRIHHPGPFPLPKSNSMLIGPTGVGKTLLIKSIAALLNVPFVIVSATAYTESGYIGEDVETMLSMLLSRAGGDIEKAQLGIIFIDEIDKIARAGQSLNVVRDVSGTGVQQALLTMIEGAEINISSHYGLRKRADDQFIKFNTSNVLFIFAGAFTRLQDIVAERTASGSRILTPPGAKYSNSDAVAERYNSIMRRATPDDIVEFGFIPEFIGRIGEIAYLSALTRADFIRIMKMSDQSQLRAYIDYFKLMGVEVSYDDGFVEGVADLAIEIGTGARSIRTVLDSVFRSMIFNLSGRKAVRKCVMTRDVVLRGRRPELFGEGEKPISWIRDTAFVGYCRKNADFYQEMKTVFAPLLRSRKITLWSDENINPGQKWKSEIEGALSRTKVAIFLVSAEFLASEYAIREELEYIIKIHRDENIHIRWVLLEPCLFVHSPLSHIQASHDLSQPLSQLTKHERHEIWMNLANEVQLVLRQVTSSMLDDASSELE